MLRINLCVTAWGGKSGSIVWRCRSRPSCIFCQTAAGWSGLPLGGNCLLASFGFCADTSPNEVNWKQLYRGCGALGLKFSVKVKVDVSNTRKKTFCLELLTIYQYHIYICMQSQVKRCKISQYSWCLIDVSHWCPGLQGHSALSCTEIMFVSD